MESNQVNHSSVLMLILIAVVGVFTLDVYLPSIPTMADQFHVSLKEITYTFTAFSLVFAVAQLFHGAFSDLFGRKPILIFGLLVAAVATIVCIYSTNYEMLFMARILQALGISAFVVVNAIVRDLFVGSKAVQVRTLIATASGVSISVAPTVGGLLQNRLGWQGGFVASLILIAVALIYALIFFSETNLSKAVKKSEMIDSYMNLFRDRKYLAHVIIAMLSYTLHFTFIVLSATIFINLLGATPITFGYLMIVYGLVYFMGGIFSGWIAKKLTLTKLIQLGSLLISFGGVLMLIAWALFNLNVINVLAPMSIMTTGITLVRSSAITGALAPIPHKAGQGSAGLNLIQFAISALITTGIASIDIMPQLSIGLLALTSAITIEYLRRKTL